MSNPLELAIKVLLREELKYVDPPASLGAAIRLLEAAWKVDKASAVQYLDDFMCSANCFVPNCQGSPIRSLLSALPDEVKK